MNPFAHRKTAFLPLTAASLIGLLALLGVLQYRWQGRISEAERERMQANLRAATERFAEDFDRELTNAYFGLQMDAVVLKNKNWAEYSQHFDAWTATAAHPAIVKNISLVRLDETTRTINFLHFRREIRNFEPAEQTTNSDKELKNLREALENRFHRKSSFREVVGANNSVEAFPPPVVESVPALVIPVVPVISESAPQSAETAEPNALVRDFRAITDFIVVTLDRDQIKNEMLPALAHRYFRGADSLDYNLAIFRRGENSGTASIPIYLSDAKSEGQDFFDADGEADLFKIRLFGAGSLVSDARNVAGGQSVPLPRSETTPLQVPLSAAPPNLNQMTVNPVSAASDEKNGAWRLAVKHRAGSLESIVESARRRNLAISFGTLILLAASVAMIVVAARRAQRLARRQTEFAANVSHEFRTPLAVISLASENLADGIVESPSEVRKYGTVIKDEVDRLTETVENVLELSAGQAGKNYQRRPVNIAAALEKAIAVCAGQIEESGFVVEKNIPENLPAVLANEAALTRAVQNLLSNSIKYAGDSRRISLKARSISTKNARQVIITVADKGIGINPEELDEIFEPFTRGHVAREKQIQGNGLGLTLVKRIIEAHGGIVSVSSAPGLGSEFSLHLPAVAPEESSRLNETEI